MIPLHTSSSGAEDNLPTISIDVVGPSLCSLLSDGLKLPIASSVNSYVKKEKILKLDQVNLDEVKGIERGKDCSSVGPMIEAQLQAARSAVFRRKLGLSLGVIVDYAKLFGFDPSKFDRNQTLANWQKCSVGCGWIKFLKYKLAAFMAVSLGGVLPKKPFLENDFPNHLSGGTLGRFISKIMRGSKALSFAVGILYSKKGMPRPDKGDLEQSRQATKEVLTTIHTRGEFDKSWIMKQEIRRTCREVFVKQITSQDLHHMYAPSVRANYTNSRSEFGTFGTLLDEEIISDIVPDEGSLIKLLQGQVLEYNNDDEMEEEGVRYVKIRGSFRKEMEQRYEKIYEDVRKRALSEDADVELVPLAEALKVRVISKGPPLTYFSLKPVQKFLLRQMRRFRMFRLVGETVTTNFLESTFKGFEGLFHSLDYQSATDLLDPEMSQTAVDEICDCVGMPDDLRILFHKALTGHLVEGIPQVWGQLMGSIVSFIILCVVNGAVIRHAYEHSTGLRCQSLDSVPAVVNGDDGLVRAPAIFSNIWEESALVAGLVPSLGKVYTHDIYANINSTSFVVLDNKFTLVNYVNMGLVTGLSRSGGKASFVNDQSERGYEDGPFYQSLGAKHHELMKTCPYNLRLKVHALFLRHHEKALEIAYVPWYIPESLGGVGLMPLVKYFGEDIDQTSRSYLYLGDHRCGPSDKEIFIAYGLHDRIHKEFSVRKVPALQPIRTRTIWQKALHHFGGEGLRVKISEQDAAFIDSSMFYIAPSLVMDFCDNTSINARIHTNQRVWASLFELHNDYTHKGVQLFLDV